MFLGRLQNLLLPLYFWGNVSLLCDLFAKFNLRQVSHGQFHKQIQQIFEIWYKVANRIMYCKMFHEFIFCSDQSELLTYHVCTTVVWYENTKLTVGLSRPFNLHPEKWFEGYPVKSTQIFFRRAPWKKLGFILINQKKIRRAPWKNLGRFYRVDFTGYPSNHFSGCRLNGRLSSKKKNQSAK